jgi:hypothetical protein
MHALRLAPAHALRAGLLALLLAVAFALMAAGFNGAGLSVPGDGGSAAATSGEVTTPPGPPLWTTSPLTPPTVELAH